METPPRRRRHSPRSRSPVADAGRLLAKMEIQPHVRDHVKCLTPSLQAQVMRRSMSGLNNPSAGLMARVNEVVRAETQPYDVQAFISTYGLPGDVAQQLRNLPVKEQQTCMSTSLTSANDKTASLRWRMRAKVVHRFFSPQRPARGIDWNRTGIGVYNIINSVLL
mmetsp:Transcript_105656/g.187884  ORF Transcript_105656/g.187884 Transcript_105656/m.187884 type:complete len:165 (-) Transcript_105656:38-532(-)